MVQFLQWSNVSSLGSHQMHIVPSTARMSITDDESPGDLPAPVVAETPAPVPAIDQETEPRARFRGRLERLRGDADAYGRQSEETANLKLELMLLREENARLKADRHRPSDLGTLIDQLRLVAAQKGEAEMIDEGWTLVSESLSIREGLEQACLEIQAAIEAVQERLRSLALQLDDVVLDGLHTQNGAIADASSAS
jgi:hypothetical protein